jgi:hypothetical protein
MQVSRGVHPELAQDLSRLMFDSHSGGGGVRVFHEVVEQFPHDAVDSGRNLQAQHLVCGGLFIQQDFRDRDRGRKGV